MTDNQPGRHSPGYDFFGSTAPVDPPAAGPQQQVRAMPPQAGVPGPAGVQSPGAVQVNQFGTPITVPAAYGAPVAQSPWAAPRPAGRSMTAMVLIGVACGFLVLILVGIMVAIAIPVYLNQHAKSTAAATTLALPAQVGTLVKLTDPASLSVASQLSATLPKGYQVGVYGNPGHQRLIVYVYPRFLPPGADAAFVASSAEGAASNGISMHVVDPGSLGGKARCGELPGQAATQCVFADSAGAVGVLLGGTGPAAESEAVAIREQVEQRRP